MPEVQVLHVPVFYGTTVSVCAKLPSEVRIEAIVAACKSAGFLVTTDADSPNGVSVAGESRLYLAPPQADSAVPAAWWFWCAADNIRLPAWNAVKLAEKLVA
jgi:aspartate-semialdehyde dehydrogenase